MTPTDDDLRFIRRFPDKCCAEVTRHGELQPCDGPATAVTVDTEDGHWWPACQGHSRKRRLVPLADLLARLA